jgi:aerobic-type carbon monoxide dehydrogenase small subunit (CoxS/CutS family)
MPKFTLNGEARDVNVPGANPLLWVLRESLGLTGTKFGCGIGECGACTVLFNGQPIRSCQFPVAGVEGAEITTIEGLSLDGSHPVQQAWVEEQVPQCGYCQSGQIMAAVALLARQETPTDADIDAAMSGNVCRCGTYPAIRRAIHRAAELVANPGAVGIPAGATSTDGGDAGDAGGAL